MGGIAERGRVRKSRKIGVVDGKLLYCCSGAVVCMLLLQFGKLLYHQILTSFGYLHISHLTTAWRDASGL